VLTVPNAAYYENIVNLWLSRNIAHPYSNQEPCDRDNRQYTLPELRLLFQETNGLVIDSLGARAVREHQPSDWHSRIVRLLKSDRLHEEELFCVVHKEGPFYDIRPEWLYRTHATSQSPLPQPLAESALRLPSGLVGPARLPRRVCKLCDETDWQGEEWLGLLDTMGPGHTRDRIHRKVWEWAQGLYALQHLGLLRDEATAIGVGAGIEPVIFYLTNHIQMVYATDIYGEGGFGEETAFGDMITHPERYAQIPFRKDHLTVMHMDGCNLEFPDDQFDIAFSFSSIEHFGGHEAAARAAKEMGRVVKPGGVAVITTEAILNGISHREFFLPEELDRYLVQASGLRLIEDIDYTLSSQTLQHPVDFGHPSCYSAIPHILCKSGHVYWTSVCLAMEKPLDE